MTKKKKDEEPLEAPEHEMKANVSDSSTSVWVTCSCGYESPFFTIEGDGKEAMGALWEEAEKHLKPPTPDEAHANPYGDEEPPRAREPGRG